MSETHISRRAALGLAAAGLAACSTSTSQMAPRPEMIAGRVREPQHRLPPPNELVNSFEFEDEARMVLAPDVYAGIAGGDREPFNRITFRPRANIPTLDMDLTVTLFGEALFTPIVVGPVSDLGTYHPDAELAVLRGAEAADTVTIVSSRSTLPFDRVVSAATGPVWYSVYADREGAAQAREVVAGGARALFITVGAQYQGPGRPPRRDASRIDWSLLDSIRQGLDVPVVLKGITSADDARSAIQRGYAGIVVSTHGRELTQRAPMDALAPIVEAVDGAVPVLIDGGFRRGSDVLKALILGADAVLVGRPVAWALAPYGADGVRWMLEKLQEELARDFAMVGASRPDQLLRNQVRFHERATA